MPKKQDFSTWIKSRIHQYCFTENEDFVLLHKKMEQVSGSKYLKEDHISINKDGSGKNTVNARGLYEFLGSKQDFSNWINGRIQAYEFIEDQDFTIVLSKMMILFAQ